MHAQLDLHRHGHQAGHNNDTLRNNAHTNSPLQHNTTCTIGHQTSASHLSNPQRQARLSDNHCPPIKPTLPPLVTQSLPACRGFTHLTVPQPSGLGYCIQASSHSCTDHRQFGPVRFGLVQFSSVHVGLVPFTHTPQRLPACVGRSGSKQIKCGDPTEPTFRSTLPLRLV